MIFLHDLSDSYSSAMLLSHLFWCSWKTLNLLCCIGSSLEYWRWNISSIDRFQMHVIQSLCIKNFIKTIFSANNKINSDKMYFIICLYYGFGDSSVNRGYMITNNITNSITVIKFTNNQCCLLCYGFMELRCFKCSTCGMVHCYKLTQSERFYHSKEYAHEMHLRKKWILTFVLDMMIKCWVRKL